LDSGIADLYDTAKSNLVKPVPSYHFEFLQ
jgi:hypothetical protein